MCCVSDSVHTCMPLMMSCMYLYGQIIFSLCSFSTHVHVQYVTKKVSLLSHQLLVLPRRLVLTILLSSIVYSTCNTHKESSQLWSSCTHKTYQRFCRPMPLLSLHRCASLHLRPTALQKPFVTFLTYIVCTSHGQSTVKGHDHYCEGSTPTFTT